MLKDARKIHALLQTRPLMTIGTAAELASVNFPTATFALARLQELGIAEEVIGKMRGRVFAYRRCLALLSKGTEQI